MDTSKLFENLNLKDPQEPVYGQLKEMFFRLKIKESSELSSHIFDLSTHTGQEKLVGATDDSIDRLKQDLPEAELIVDKLIVDETSIKFCWVKMENIDFKAGGNYFTFFDESFSKLIIYSASNRFACLMRLVNNIMLQWNAEFQLFCKDNQQKINYYEIKRLLNVSKYMDCIDYLESKLRTNLYMHRRLLPNSKDTIFKNLESQGATIWEEDIFVLKNMILKFKKFWLQSSRGFTEPDLANIGWNVTIFNNNMRESYNVKGLYSAETFFEIDSRIPQWMEENEILREDLKSFKNK